MRDKRTIRASTTLVVVDIEAGGQRGQGYTYADGSTAHLIQTQLADVVHRVEQLAVDELLVAGSMGQRRPHPLLKTEQELRKEISEGLKELTFRVEQEALLLQANALTRGERSAAHRIPERRTAAGAAGCQGRRGCRTGRGRPRTEGF